MSTNHIDNSTTIKESTICDSQIAPGSNDFQGSIKISAIALEDLERLTISLIDCLHKNPVQDASSDEIADAIKQVEAQVKQKTVNKLSIKGILSGISMVIQNGKNVSENLISLYDQWSTFVHNLIS